MRFNTAQYLEKEQVTVSIRNNNTANAILDGQPVFLDGYNAATNLGVDVHDYAGITGNKVGLLLGVAKSQSSAGLAKGDVGEAVVYGFTDAIIVRRNRAAGSDAWSSIASIAAGDPLVPEANGYFGTDNQVGLVARASLASDASLAAATLNVTLPVLRGVNAGESKQSLQTAATDYLGTALYETVRMKVLVRLMG